MLNLLLLGPVAAAAACVIYPLARWLAPRLLREQRPTIEPPSEPAPSEPGLPRPGTLELTRVLPVIGTVGALALAAAVTVRPAASPSPLPGQGARAAASPPGASAPAEPALPTPSALQVLGRAGGPGEGPAQLHDPRDVTVDGAGNLYVADTGNHRVVELDPSGKLIAQWADSPKGQLVEPAALAATPDGVIVVDSQTGQVHKYQAGGTPVAAFERDLALFHPRWVTVDPAGNVWICDTGRNRLVELKADGTPAAEINGGGVLSQPTSVALDPQGNLYVAEPDAGKLVQVSAKGSAEAEWPLPHSSTVLPPHLLWLPGRGLLASDPEQQALLLYSTQGTVQRVWDAEGLAKPLGLAPASNGTSVWVVSNQANELLRLALPAAG